jgi:hypothetical protein
MSSRQPLRYEFKIPCARSQLSEIEAWVRLHPLHWRNTYPPRQVNNVYFDTSDYRSLNDNLSGIGARRKLRIRWYGSDLGHIVGGHIELKCKEGLVGWKVFSPLERELDLQHQPWSVLLRQLRRHAPTSALRWFDAFPEPTLINHYWRTYYETTDGVLRLTIDTNLRAYIQRMQARPNLRKSAPPEAHMVVELKSPVDNQAYGQLVAVLQSFPLRTGRYSKYVQGVLQAPQFDRVMVL